MHVYAKSLYADGLLFMSGFYEEDLAVITEKANELGLIMQKAIVKNKWVGAIFKLN